MFLVWKKKPQHPTKQWINYQGVNATIPDLLGHSHSKDPPLFGEENQQKIRDRIFL